MFDDSALLQAEAHFHLLAVISDTFSKIVLNLELFKTSGTHFYCVTI